MNWRQVIKVQFVHASIRIDLFSNLFIYPERENDAPVPNISRETSSPIIKRFAFYDLAEMKETKEVKNLLL